MAVFLRLGQKQFLLKCVILKPPTLKLLYLTLAQSLTVLWSKSFAYYHNIFNIVV